MTERLQNVLAAIDAANSADPRQDEGRPEALLYGERMSAELDRLFPDASEPLRIAARGQHVERWKLARDTYPEGRAGYLAWRRAQAVHHAERISALMQDAGYGAEDIEATGRMLRKEGIKRDPQVQALEDVICFVFLRWYFAPFAVKHSPDKVLDIVVKTARKMSAGARNRVLDEFDLPEDLAAAFRI
ncbi:DUF4202 domain-containing protein [Ruegeria marina]|uniref:DUF4202 domain-containing protein n=1 Tax=Ruegeria marina TaxID=639004 RepID=A0A1G7CTM2_9RHOB|nr:DUF4202 domain-containing protein [Ruegeria marina]SDE42647.1 protein of unknown function [Ruegeria marina]